MSKYEHTKYPPGIYLEMYHAIDEVPYSRPSGGLHAYLVYRTPDGRTLVLRGGQPTSKNQGLLVGNTFGLLGGYVETQTGALSDSYDHYSNGNRPHRMVIPVVTGAYDAVLWEKATRRVKEINEQQYDYDVTISTFVNRCGGLHWCPLQSRWSQTPIPKLSPRPCAGVWNSGTS